MGSFNFLFSLFGWTFIPDFATRHLLHLLYSSPLPLRPSQQGSMQHRRHYATAFAFVIFSYLVYTLVQSARAMPPNFYEILGVRPDVDENGLKLAFRAFAKRYHPDRAGRQGEELFMYVRDAFEALKDPSVRFAYDRFGPEAVTWRQHCKTTRDFLQQGLMVSSGYHIIAGITLLFWSAIGEPSVVSFWRYVLFGTLLAAELSFILSPFPHSETNLLATTSTSLFGFFSSSTPISTTALSSGPTLFPASYSVLQRVFPNRVPYQHILFLHQLFMVLSVALSRVVPRFIVLLGKDNSGSRKLGPLERAVWEKVYGTIAVADREASLILHTILQSVNNSSSLEKPSSEVEKPWHEPTLARMHPLSPARTFETLDKLTPEMQALIMEANIKNQVAGPIANAWEAALRRVGQRARSASPFPFEAEGEFAGTGSGLEELEESVPTSVNGTETPKLPAQTPPRFDLEGSASSASWVAVDGTSESVSRLSRSPRSPYKQPGTPPQLTRTPSMTRVHGDSVNFDGGTSPTKVHSPARTSAGEI